MQQSCTKIDTSDLKGNIGQFSNAEITQQFFNVPANAPSAIKRIVKEMKLRNTQNEFIPLFVKRYGYPVWDKPLISTGSNNAGTTQAFRNTATNSMGEDDSDTLVVLPLSIENSSYVNSFVTARLDSSIVLNLYRGSDYSTYTYAETQGTQINADKAASQIMYLNYYVYGHTTFTTTDVHLFSDGQPYTGQIPKVLKLEPEAEANLNHTYTLEVCVTSPADGGCTCPGNHGNLATCTCTIYNCCWQRKCSYTDFGGGIGGEPQGGNGPTSTPGTPTNPAPGGNGPAGGGGGNTPFPCPATQDPNNPIPGCEDNEPDNVIPLIDDGTDHGFNPCQYIDSLMKTPTFLTMLQNLKDSLNNGHEIAYSYSNPLSTTPAIPTFYTGLTSTDNLSVTLDLTSKADVVGHNHYVDPLSLNIYSAEDLYKLYEYYRTNKMNGSKNFVFPLVTQNSQFIIMITEPIYFDNFGKKWLKTPALLKLFKTKVYTDYHVHEDSSVTSNAIHFLDAIKSTQNAGENGGIKLFMKTGINKFSPVTSFNGTLVQDPCL